MFLLMKLLLNVNVIYTHPLPENQNTYQFISCIIANSMLVRAIKNAKIDTVVKEPEITRMYQVPKKMSDDLKSTLENLLGKPKSAEYNYKIEWAGDSCGKIVLMKPSKGTSVLFCNTKGAAWMKTHVVGIVE
jgi:hypothetical protein